MRVSGLFLHHDILPALCFETIVVVFYIPEIKTYAHFKIYMLMVPDPTRDKGLSI